MIGEQARFQRLETSLPANAGLRSPGLAGSFQEPRPAGDVALTANPSSRQKLRFAFSASISGRGTRRPTATHIKRRGLTMPHIQPGQQPVTQITIIEAEPDKQGEALSLMTERARFMARQPGFISISLHRSLDGKRIVNYVQWQSSELLRSAHRSPEFRKEWRHFDQLTEGIDPHLYEVAQVIDGGH
jgi:heme-degrading monooxygenase HmoA